MSKKLSRRSFMKTSAVTASAATLVSAGSARGYAANEKVQLGWIGIGGRCHDLLPQVVEHCPDARTAAVCDLLPERVEKGKQMAAKDKPVGYTNFREMMAKEKLDGIMVVTEPNKHAEVVVPVLEAGFPCFAEKPMDITVQTVDAITKAARAARKKDPKCFYQIGTQRRYHPAYLACMEEIQKGLIGKVTFMRGGWHWSGDPSMARVERDGGRLIEQASHHMDVFSWAMKNAAPVVCVAMASAQHQPPEGPNVYSETHSATVFKFADGTLFSYTHLWLLPGAYDQEVLDVFGEKGVVDLNKAKYIGRDEKTKQIAEPSGKDWGKGTVEELVAFVDNLKSGGKKTVNADVEAGRICSLMCIMGRMAMVNKEKNAYEPRVIHWKDLGTTTDL